MKKLSIIVFLLMSSIIQAADKDKNAELGALKKLMGSHGLSWQTTRDRGKLCRYCEHSFNTQVSTE